MIQKFTRKKIQFAYISIILIWVLGAAFSSNPPNGRTGAPGEGLCTDCHSPGASQNGDIQLTNFPASITANQTYSLTLTMNNPDGTAQEGGFQMTVLNGSNQQAGNLTMPSSSTVVTPSGGREYWEHNPSLDFPGSNQLVWTVDWTAPSGPDMDQITFYAAGNVANGNGSNSGDLIVQDMGSGTLMGGADPLSAVILNSSNATCEGGADGSATAGGMGGTPPYSFNWSDGQSTATASGLAAGMYTVTVTDQSGSTATTTVEITAPPLLEITNTSVTNVSCNGGADGSISITPAGGTPGYTVLWSNNSTGNIIAGLTAGNYSVTVTDANDCTVSQSFNVTQSAFLDIAIDTQTDVLCFGDNSGEVELLITGGTAPYTIDWSNGANGTVQTNLPAGNYMATVTDANLCQNVQFVSITEPEELIVELSIVDDAFCFGGNEGGIEILVEGGIGPYSVDWSNGQSGTTILELAAGDYTVSATDANNCLTTLTVTVGQPDEIIISTLSLNHVSCFGDTDGSIEISISGGTEPYDIIEWSNGFFGTNPADLAPGTYTVNVMDVNVCEATTTITIDEPTEVMPNVTSTDETMAGANDGTATATPTGGTPPYTYLWSTAETTPSISNLTPGQYTVTVTDANNCSSTQSITINEFGCLFTITTTATHVTCNGDADGSISVVVDNNAQAPILILWSTGDTTASIENLGAGQYSVTVTDANNCQKTELVNITEPPAITVNCVVTDISGVGMMDGSISCSATGGADGFTYSWSNGATTDSIGNLGAGTYMLTVTDGNGCTLETSTTLSEVNCMLVLNANVTDIACNGAATGEIMLLLNGSIDPVTYMWSNGETTATISNLTAGEYSVIVTDGNSCTIADTFHLSELPPIEISVDTIIHASATGNDGSIEISVTGGIGPLTFVWSLNGAVISTTMNPMGLSMGFYNLVVTDQEGCTTFVDSIEVQGTVGFNPLEDLVSWSIYPNPTSDLLNIKMSGFVEIDFKIYDAKGQKVLNKKLVEGVNSILLSDLNQGLYYLSISNEIGTSIKKLIRL